MLTIDKPDEDDLQQIFVALGHPIRIKIIEMISQAEFAGFTRLKTGLNLSVGSLYYHLEVLGNLITQNSQRKYILSNVGEVAHEFLQNNREQLKTSPKLSLAGSSRFERFIREFLFGRYFLAKVSNTPKPYFVLIFALLIVGGWMYGQSSIEPILLFYNTVPMWNNLFVIGGELILTWFILFILTELFSQVYYRRNGGKLALLIGTGFALLPLFLLPGIMTVNEILALGWSLDAFWITIGLLICQGWTLLLLTAAIGFAKGLLFEKAALISLSIIYVNIGYLVLFVFIL